MPDPTATPPVAGSSPPSGPTSGGPDSTLVNAAQQLATAKSKALAAGQSITPEDAEAFVRQSTGGKYGAGDAVQYLTQQPQGPTGHAASFDQLAGNVPVVGPALVAAHRLASQVDPNSAFGKVLDIDKTIADQGARGVSQGFMPKAAGLMAGAQSFATNGADLGKALADYKATRDAWKQRYAQEQQAHPIIAPAADLAGSIASPVNYLVPGAAPKTALNAVMQGAKLGAVTGGLRAAGETVGDAGDYTKNIGMGVGGGAVAGGVFGVGGQLLGKIAAKVQNYAAPFYAKAFAEAPIKNPAIVNEMNALADEVGFTPIQRGAVPGGAPKMAPHLDPNGKPTLISPQELDQASQWADIENSAGNPLRSAKAAAAESAPSELPMQRIDDIKRAVDTYANNLKSSWDNGDAKNRGVAIANRLQAVLAQIDHVRPNYAAARQAGAEGAGKLIDLLRAAAHARGGSVGALANLATELSDVPASQRALGFAPGATSTTAATLLSALQNASQRQR